MTRSIPSRSLLQPRTPGASNQIISRIDGWPAEIAKAVRRRVRAELGLPISVGVARTKHLAKIALQVAKPDGLVVVDPETELDFLHDLPVELMWGRRPGHQGAVGRDWVLTIGQLAKSPQVSLKPAGAHLLADPVAGRSDHGRCVIDADRDYRATNTGRAANLSPAPRGVCALPDRSRAARGVHAGRASGLRYSENHLARLGIRQNPSFPRLSPLTGRRSKVSQ
jgi:hypothetical protein